mgnify:CR=1 FL=1
MLAWLTSPLRDRFGVVVRLDFYAQEELQTIVSRSAQVLQIGIDEAGTAEVARRSRGTPRIANRLLKRVRDYAQVRADGFITQAVAAQALRLLEVDDFGLDKMDRQLLLTIIDKFNGGPVGARNPRGLRSTKSARPSRTSTNLFCCRVVTSSVPRVVGLPPPGLPPSATPAACRGAAQVVVAAWVVHTAITLYILLSLRTRSSTFSRAALADKMA